MLNFNEVLTQIVSIRRFFVLRNTLKISAVVISVSCYYLLFEYNAPAENFLTMIFDREDEFSFYSGEQIDFYYDIGEHLDSVYSPESSFDIENVPSQGSLDNLNSVMLKPKSIGLANEVVSPIGDFSRDEINFVTPLYTEQMYIFYRKSRYYGEGPLELKANPDTSVTNFLNRARINGGPHGSGTRLLSSYILASIEGHDHLPLLNMGFDSAIHQMKPNVTNRLDINLSIMGPKHSRYDSILRAGDYGLASIDPSLLVEIDAKHKLNLRTINYDYYGPELQNATVIGSYVYLIASKDVRNGVLKNIIETLEKDKNAIRSKVHDHEGSPPLDSRDFKKDIIKLGRKERSSLFKSGVLFLISTVLSSMAFLWFLVTLISKSRVAQHYWEIAFIYKEFIPLKTNLKDTPGEINIPVIESNVQDKINVLTAGFDIAFKEINTAFTKYQNGGITESDYKNLLQEFHVMIADMCQEMHRLLFFAIQKDGEITKELLESFFVSNFLNSDQYEHLCSTLEDHSGTDT